MASRRSRVCRLRSTQTAKRSGRALIAAYLDLCPFCAWRDGKLVARVSAVVNQRYNDHWKDKLGQLIHFEAMTGEEDAVAAMMDHALEWLAQRGMEAARSGVC